MGSFSHFDGVYYSLTAIKVLVDVAVVGRAASMMQREERKNVIEELKRAQHEFSQLYNESKVGKLLNTDSVDEVWSSPQRNSSESSLATTVFRRQPSQMSMSSNTTYVCSLNFVCVCFVAV